MRNHTALYLVLVPAFFSGCLLDPNSRWNVNRGSYRDEWTQVGSERNSDQEVEKEPDPMGKWLYSPKARSIFNNLGSDQ